MDNKFSVNSNGIIKEYNIIKILAPKDFEHKYIIYTDKDNNYFASRFVNVNGDIILEDIDNEFERDYIDKRMEEINSGN